MSRSFAKDFLKTFEEIDLPEEIANQFDIVDFLGQNSFSETFKLMERNSGRYYVLKRCRKTEEIPFFINESDILGTLSFKGIPRFEPNLSIENGDYLFTICEYIEGITLDEYLPELKCDEGKIVDIIMELCDILTYLHSQPAPIIHRDINPSNIVINTDNNVVTLIDFGICRIYSEGAKADTVCFGTTKFAPPEQYGFSQTDCRADIYPLGILLRYMITGSADKDSVIKNKTLERIASKCSEFSPDKRYQSANAVKKRLQRYKKGVNYVIISIIYTVLSMCLILIILWYTTYLPKSIQVDKDSDDIKNTSVVLTYNEINNEDIYSEHNKEINNNIVIFKEPLIEEAVRCVLNKDESEAIFYEDLNLVTSIFIVGNKVAPNRDKFMELLEAWYTNHTFGSIESLVDCNLMINLEELSINAQPLSDITPISKNVHLAILDIFNCNVVNASPVIPLQRLVYLNLYGDMLKDFSIFGEIESLKWLSVGGMSLRDINELGYNPNLTFIHLGSTEINSLEGIERFDTLKSINLHNTKVKDFSPLNKLPFLEEIEISTDMEIYLETLTRDDIEIKSW